MEYWDGSETYITRVCMSRGIGSISADKDYIAHIEMA
jgi:hypothetical protein